MPEYLETTVDKFIFKVATDRLYTQAGVWAKEEGGGVRIGLSDFVQQRSGDVAFADVQPQDTRLAAGEAAAEIETIKVTESVLAPVSGVIAEVNPQMEDSPEVINQDPYGEGWLLLLEPDDWETERVKLMPASDYFIHMKAEAEEEAKKL
jgi:glycine cleavage system H protein